jgi:two-component sensor histidine kinase
MATPMAIPVCSSNTFSWDPAEVAAARAWVLSTVPLPIGHPRAADLAVVVTELASNALRHSMSGAPGGRYCVQVELDPDSTAESGALRLTCIDMGPGAGMPDERETVESGRGLVVVRRLVDDYAATTTDTSRQVWCRLTWPGSTA